MKKNVGIVGFRGMVGSVLVSRMLAERDFDHFEPHFFSTSQAGEKAPDIGRDVAAVADATKVEALAKMDMIVSCQGGDWTTEMHPALRRAGFKGFFIDAASTLRMRDDAVIVLDPVNRAVIDRAIAGGVRDLVGGNCTVSLMLMAVHALFERGLVEWMSSMTYQAASGAGAKQMRELCAQMRVLSTAAAPVLDDPASTALDLDRVVTGALRSDALPRADLGAPLAANLLPWIDKPVDAGQSREEWKGHAETNKIMGLDPAVPVDGICVRVAAMRCHSQGLTIKLKRDVPLAELEEIIRTSNAWVRLVPNDKETTLRDLTPAAISGNLEVAIGRLRKLKMGPEYVGAFTVGDQLLWGAAEPLRRVLRIVLERG
ncbi:MAG: aspartate-semialdehyde dehydrogenase [Polyangiaceae bacterium]